MPVRAPPDGAVTRQPCLVAGSPPVVSFPAIPPPAADEDALRVTVTALEVAPGAMGSAW